MGKHTLVNSEYIEDQM